jgi:hypothetical protein
MTSSFFTQHCHVQSDGCGWMDLSLTLDPLTFVCTLALAVRILFED